MQSLRLVRHSRSMGVSDGGRMQRKSGSGEITLVIPGADPGSRIYGSCKSGQSYITQSHQDTEKGFKYEDGPFLQKRLRPWGRITWRGQRKAIMPGDPGENIWVRIIDPVRFDFSVSLCPCVNQILTLLQQPMIPPV